MKLRLCIGAISLTAAAFLGVASAAGEAGPSKGRPNFVVIIADDLAWNDTGPYGHPKVRTPNLDRLAREGVRFDRALLTTSSCSPSRSSILTGRYPHATGAPELHQPLPATQTLVSEPLRKAGYYTGAAGKWHLGGAVKNRFDTVLEGGGVSGCENWMKLLRERPRNQPFFVWLAAVDPHRPYQPGAVDPPHAPGDAVVPPFLPDNETTRRDLAHYYDEITRMDGFIGQVMTELEQQQIARETFILFLSDNGRPFPRCKTTLTDDGIRTPFIVRFPSVVRAGSTCGSIVSSVDIAPTLCDLAGLEKPATFQGKSFARLLRDPKSRIRKHAFAEHNWHDYRAFERGVRSERYTYIRNFVPELPGTPPADAVKSPTFQEMRRLYAAGSLGAAQAGVFKTPRAPEELFDLERDPHSLRNLALEAAHTEVLKEHRRALDDWIRETGDSFDSTRLTPDRFDRETGLPK